MRYEIEENTYAVRIFNAGSDVACIFQPDWPDTTPWASSSEAAQWAELYILSCEDESAPYAPSGPGQIGQPKPTPEEVAEIRARMERRATT